MWDLTISIYVNVVESEEYGEVRDNILLSFKSLPGLINFIEAVQDNSILKDDEGLEFTIIKQ